MIFRSYPVTCAALLVLALSVPSALANPVGSEPQALQPYSRTAQAITGPIILSNTRIVFGNGEMLDLRLLEATSGDTWGVSGETIQLFEATGDIGPVMNGNTICSDGSPRFMTAHESEGMGGSWLLGLDFYSGDKPQAGDPSPSGSCGSYNYMIDSPTAASANAPPTSGADLPTSLAAPSLEVSSDPGKWMVTRDTNPVDDTSTVVVSLLADTGRSRWGDAIRFVARCQSNSTEAYVVWHDYVGDDSSDVYSEFKYVTVRVGDAPAREERWTVSTSNDATFAPGWAGDLLKEMLASDQLVLRLTPYGESPITAVFDTGGLNVALRDLAATCNWSY